MTQDLSSESVDRQGCMAAVDLVSFDVRRSARQRRVWACRSASLVRATLRFAFPAVRGLVARRRTHYAHCVRCVQTAATSQSLKRAARAATSPVLLGAPEAHYGLPTRAFAGEVVVFAPKTSARAARRAVPGRGDLWGGEERSAGVGARSALRDLIRRGCLSAAPAGRVASSATRPRRDAVRPDMEQSPADCSVPGARPCACKRKGRSGVGAKRRPHQREPLSGTARRAAPNCRRRRTLVYGSDSREPEIQ
jgi:hypothetical protein